MANGILRKKTNMEYYQRKGIVTFGKFYECDWVESTYEIIAKAGTLEGLEREVEKLTKENTSNGYINDVGYRSGVFDVKWHGTKKFIEEDMESVKEERESVKVLRECIELQNKKSNDYQNPNSRIKHSDYYPRGLHTITDICWAKILRIYSVLEAMEKDNNYSPNYESLEDSLKDLINYSSFAVAFIRGKL